MNALSAALKATVWHWRTHLPAIALIALATSVVTGALEVETSVRASLSHSLVTPLGNTQDALVAFGTFSDLLAPPGTVPGLTLSCTASNDSGQTTGRTEIWALGLGADRIWPGVAPPGPGSAMVTEALARDLGLATGSRLFIRVASPNAPPLSSVFGKRLASQSTVELAVDVAKVIPDGTPLAGFSLVPSIATKRTVFVNLSWLTHQLRDDSRANLLLSTQPLSYGAIADRMTLTDHGLTLDNDGDRLIVRSVRVLLSPGQLDACRKAARKCGSRYEETLVALAEEVRNGKKSASYVVAASIESLPEGRLDLNAWAASDLQAKVGDRIALDLLVPRPDGTFGTSSVTERLREILPMKGEGADRCLVPDLSGMTDSKSISDWDTPFPIDLARVTSRDEVYWKRYRAAPRVFIDRQNAQLAWGTGHAVTAVVIRGGRLDDFNKSLLESLAPIDSGLSIVHVRSNAERAAYGASDLGALLLGLSSFLVLAALGLSGSLILLNLQSRSKELVLMRSVGIPRTAIIASFGFEAVTVAVAGSVIGSAASAALAKVSLLMFSRWLPGSSFVGEIPVVARSSDLLLGGFSGLLCASIALFLYLRKGFRVRSPRRIHVLRAHRSTAITPAALILRLIRNYPLRIASVALVVCASTATLTAAAGSLSDSVAAGRDATLVMETSFPLDVDWTAAVGRRRLHFDPTHEHVLRDVTALALMRSRGTDASCLNPAKPATPRIASVSAAFLRTPPFPAYSETGSDAWPLLDRPEEQPVPAIADSDTLDWILESGIGRTYHLDLPDGSSTNLRFVGTTRGSYLPGDLLIPQRSFRKLFPGVEGPTLFLISCPQASEQAVRQALMRDLADYGPTITSSRSILDAVRGVYNAYVSIFLVFGSLGVLLGVCGSALAAARNAMARRAEFALMVAVGVPRATIGYLLIAETNIGVLAGTLAGIAIGAAAAVAERPAASWFMLLTAALLILGASTAACLLVSRFFLQGRLLEALRSE